MKTITLITLGMLAGATAANAAVLYDNTQNTTTRQTSALTELGDQIRLFSPDPANTVVYSLTLFSFEYFAGDQTGGTNPGANLSGDEQAVLRFYLNDGPLENGVRAPGTVVYTSPAFGISNTEGSVLEYTLANVIVPDVFTWTVEFTGLTGTERAGLNIYTPPAVGDNVNIAWQRDGGGVFRDIVGANGEALDFGAYAEGTLTIVPEPGSIALFGIGALGLLAFHRRFKSNR